MQTTTTNSRLRSFRRGVSYRGLKFIGLQLAFIVLSVLMFYSIIATGKAIYSADDIFHWQRIVELAEDFRHGIFPQFNAYTGLLGTATPTTYPWLNLVPSALLHLIGIKPVQVIDVYLVSALYLGLNISFYSYRSLKRSNLSSFVFATLYCISTLFSSLYFPQTEIGELFSVMVAPLAFIGWIHLIKNHRYRMMTTGFVLMASSHIMSTIIIIVSLGLLTLFSARMVDKKTFVAGCKSGAVFLLTTMILWLPTLVLLETNRISTPTQLPMKKAATLIPVSLNMAMADGFRIWWLTDLIAILFGFCNFKRLSRITKRSFILALVLLFGTFNWLPWGLIQSTFIGQMQFPYRLSFLSHLLLMYVLAEIFRKGFKPGNRAREVVFYGMMMMFTLLSVGIFNRSGISIGAGQHVKMTNVYSIDPHKPMKQWPINRGGVEMTNRDLNDPRTLRMLANGDYLQSNTVKSLSTRKASRRNVNGHKSTPVGRKQYGNRISFYAERNVKHVRIPLTPYHAQKYRMLLNGRPVKYSMIDGLTEISNVPKGHNEVTYRTPMMWYRWVAIIGTVAGVIILLTPRDLDPRKTATICQG